jgi:hypothetical protein
MRWLKRSPVPEGEPESVLQYRVFRTQRIVGDHAMWLADWSDDYGWSAWIDVPTERSDD